MTARAGMANLIAQLRVMTDAGTADYVVAGTTYWTDDHLQAVLDASRTDIYRALLSPEVETVAGGDEYHNYYTTCRNFEEATSGTPIWQVEDANGEVVSTANYTVNYPAGQFRFATDTEGSAYYLTTRAYHLEKAAATVWERKAAHVADRYDFTADGASYKRSQAHAHYLQMAQYYRARSGVQVGRLFRDDVWA